MKGAFGKSKLCSLFAYNQFLEGISMKNAHLIWLLLVVFVLSFAFSEATLRAGEKERIRCSQCSEDQVPVTTAGAPCSFDWNGSHYNGTWQSSITDHICEPRPPYSIWRVCEGEPIMCNCATSGLYSANVRVAYKCEPKSTR